MALSEVHIPQNGQPTIRTRTSRRGGVISIKKEFSIRAARREHDTLTESHEGVCGSRETAAAPFDIVI
jgi:hypothetical protein